jgi:hypothetical protein
MANRDLPPTLSLLGLLAPLAASGCLFPQVLPEGAKTRAPSSFPWPPPAASAHDDLTGALPPVSPDATLGLWAARLSAALAHEGYSEQVYHPVPTGFALVTRLEQIDGQGRPRPAGQRWSSAPAAPELFSVGSYLRSVFLANPGRFRLFVFVVSAAPFGTTAAPPAHGEARAWSRSGLLSLPPEIAALPLQPGHRCAALVYEFERPHADSDPRFVDASPQNGHQHLRASGLLRELSGS